ncbi:MAG: hypothetical protein R3D71_06005 [Rickettsiales bacterium]
MKKFNRNYRLSVQVMVYDGGSWKADSDKLIFSYPLTAEFSIKRSIGGDFNSMDINLYNLDETVRRKIYQNRFTASKEISDFKSRMTLVELEAGYGDDIKLVHKGRILDAANIRQGANIITHIHSVDNGIGVDYTNTYETFSVPSNKRLIEELAKTIPFLQVGVIADDNIRYDKAVSISDNTYSAIQKLAGDDAFIDLGILNVLKPNQVINDELVNIDSSTGLLRALVVGDSNLVVSVLFEPSVRIGQAISLSSEIQPEYNGTYKIIAIQHDCVISGAVGGICQTTLQLNSVLSGFKKFEYIGKT